MSYKWLPPAGLKLKAVSKKEVVIKKAASFAFGSELKFAVTTFGRTMV